MRLRYALLLCPTLNPHIIGLLLRMVRRHSLLLLVDGLLSTVAIGGLPHRLTLCTSWGLDVLRV